MPRQARDKHKESTPKRVHRFLAGNSLYNPYDVGDAAEFNMFFYLSQYFSLVYGTMCWQGDQGYNACAITPHAAQMSSVIQRLRMQLQNLAMLLLPLAALMVMHLPEFTGCAPGADPVRFVRLPSPPTEAEQCRDESLVCPEPVWQNDRLKKRNGAKRRVDDDEYCAHTRGATVLMCAGCCWAGSNHYCIII